MPTYEIIMHNLVHVGAVLYLVCFLFRNQILLRLLAIAGDIVYTVYYYGAADIPLWNAIYWNVLTIIVNFGMIYLILRENSMTRLDDDQLRLFRNLGGVSPGQFRALMRIGQWKRTSGSETLTREGVPLNRLYYVLDGDVRIEKDGRSFMRSPAVFIGELAYLRGKPATATVTLPPDAVYVEWSSAALQKLSAKDSELRSALIGMLSTDMAEKIALS